MSKIEIGSISTGSMNIGDSGIRTEGKRIDSVTYTPKSYSWNPQEDITTYELALCLPVLLTSIYVLPVETQINDLPENCRRHFEEE